MTGNRGISEERTMRTGKRIAARNLALTGVTGALLALTACGGGDDSPAPNPTPVATLQAVPDNVSVDPTVACSMSGIGATPLTADTTLTGDIAAATILDVSTSTTGAGPSDKPYCLVKVKVDPQINIWVTLPTSAWNGRLRSEGGGGYAGSVGVAADSVRQGFAGVQTDTGHPAAVGGAFGMASVGVPNAQLQVDFAYRSEHLMAVIGKQLVKAFYAQDPYRTYWYGCSTGGRQGMRMAQQFPDDYDAILAGAPAMHWDRFQAYQIWPQVVMRAETGGPIARAKLALATSSAVNSCDAADGVTDGVIGDPRTCQYDVTKDSAITTSTCTSADNTCLTIGEASAIQKIWGGARNTSNTLLWPGVERGADLSGLAGTNPFAIAVQQPQYWVYFDPTWDWTTLNYANYEAFFNQTVAAVGPLMASDDPDLTRFRARGGKVIMFHGWADQLIMSEGTTLYYDAMQQSLSAANVPNDFAKLYMVPGMGHCGGGAGPNQFGQGNGTTVPQTADRDIFRALMAWSEKGTEPQAIVATHFTNNNTALAVDRTRPLCVYPQVAKYSGSGSTDDAANFTCSAP